MKRPSPPAWRRLWRFVHEGYFLKFLIVGGASFAIDLGTLTLLHEAFAVDLWIATPIAFVVSLLFNFMVQRKYTFQSTTRHSVSFLKYVALVVFNIAATDVIVNLVVALGWDYAMGKVISTIMTMAWNYLLYRHWIFRSPKPRSALRESFSPDRPASS